MGSSRRTIVLPSVDLPQPDGPTRTINSLSFIFKLKSKTEYKNYSPNKAIKEIVLKLPMRQQISEKLMKGNKDRFVKIKWEEVLNVQRKIRNDKIDEILK